MVSILYVLIVLVCFVAPITLTLYNVYFLFKRSHESRFEPAIERWTWSLGIILSLVFVRFMYMFKGDWQEVLVNGATHNPIASEEQPVILWLIVIGLTGYFLLKFSKEKRLPPLVMVFAIAGTYIGIFVAAIWIVQLSNHILVVIFLGLPAFNFIGVENNQRTNRCLARRSYPCRKKRYLSKSINEQFKLVVAGVYFHVTYSRDFFSSTYFIRTTTRCNGSSLDRN